MIAEIEKMGFVRKIIDSSHIHFRLDDGIDSIYIKIHKKSKQLDVWVKGNSNFHQEITDISELKSILKCIPLLR